MKGGQENSVFIAGIVSSEGAVGGSGRKRRGVGISRKCELREGIRQIRSSGSEEGEKR